LDWGYDPFGKRVVGHQQMSNYGQWILSFYSPAGQLLGKVACTADTNYNNPGPTDCAGYGANTYFGGRLVSRTQ